VVVWLGAGVLTFRPPLARARVAVGDGRWRLRMRSARHRLELEGEAGDAGPHLLPVPELGAPRVEMRSRQVLAGQIRLRLRRGARTLIDASSPLAGLELGDPLPPRPAGPPQ
jgi:tocopherol cyclase